MFKYLLYDTANPTDPVATPFAVSYGTSAPSAGAGNNGDYYFRYNDGAESIYKKSGGTWHIIDSSGTQPKFNGLEDGSLFTVTYVPATRIFTVTCAANARVWINGSSYDEVTESTSAHANTTGKYYLYYDIAGTLTVSNTFWDLSVTAPVAVVYYNATTAKAILLNEKHPGVTGMDNAVHLNLHRTRGTQIVSGFAVFGYTLNTAGASALSYAVDTGIVADEDLYTTISALADGGPYRILSLSGASAEWIWSDTSTTGILDNGTNIYYNQFTGGAWQQTAITSNNTWVNYYIFALPTSTMTGANPGIIAIMGQTTYGSLATAQAEDPSILAGVTSLTDEGVFVARMTYRRVGGSSPSNAQLASVQPIRTSVISITSGFVPTDHSSLSNRSATDSHPASAISADTATFGGYIDSTATTVQLALESIETRGAAYYKAQEREMVTGSNKSVFTTTYTFNATQKIDVWNNGILLTEVASGPTANEFTRTVGNTITTGDAVRVNGEFKVRFY